MIKVTLNLSPTEYANLLRMRELLNRTNRGGVSDDDVEQYRKVYDRTQSGVMLAAMMAAEDHHAKNGRRLQEVVNG